MRGEDAMRLRGEGVRRFTVRSRLGVGLTAVIAVAAASATLAPAAQAAVSCDLDGTLLNVSMTEDFDRALIAPGSTQIQVRAGGPVLTCANGPATVNNTDLIRVTDYSDDALTPAANDGRTTVTVHDAPAFVPGKSAEGDGVSEIEFIVDLRDGLRDEFTVYSTTAGDNVRLGRDGLNWNVGAPADDELFGFSGIDQWTFYGLEGNDTISARGGEATGNPFNGPGTLELWGDADNDQLSGGDGIAGDLVLGREGDDDVLGFAGDDRLVPGFGDDTIVGGAGTADIVDYGQPLSAGGVIVDLSTTDPQPTGQLGTDTISQTENVDGTNSDDVLTGSTAANVLRGQVRSDTFDGGAGDDILDAGGGAADRVTYAQAPAGVTANLTTGTATGGAGTDTFFDVDDLIGSPFADSLIGSATANSITGLGGADEVSALAGTDAVDVRDGGADIASCGTEIDSAVADQETVDSVSPDCETISFLPAEGGGGGGGDNALEFRLSGCRTQDVLNQRGAYVNVLCPLESCTVVLGARGKLPRGAKLKLKPATAELAADMATRIRLRLRKRHAAPLRDALSAPRSPKLKVTATATDAAGNAVTRTRKIAVTG